ncbi:MULTISPECIES: polysaccharide biosynthesis/export family protein [unclassified Marivivens]|uniref:polysaccharide biosynthesis/export family protein n=1 Tax=unclassified Marivivens TaxID=2622455 RepID=UPI0007FDA687|nr:MULTISPECIES: polysaccharide biosynthesis/export family protein [unclassified Marivivens]MCL7406433.1 polysaccharide biosynthesis/export family protein [Marivivens geojensis]OBR35857.1 sugar ABC transporter substrate-binding protein [Donghicola sp. JL3646]APO87345.1 sugar ABC transporter substrate-binding protein [Marivivens sp. JLT3646]NBQ49374.1 polysaccharide export protein [Marivivens sp.]NBT52071.1 polysaccharide export protein [Marivivens sp.]
MSTLSLRLARGAALIAACSLLGACGLPRSGPNKSEIFAGSVMREGDAFVLIVDDRVNRIASVSPALGFSSSLENAAILGSDVISAGDVLGLTIWENVDDGLLVPQGQNATVLNELQVDGAGFIYVPYAGRVRAAGNSPERIRQIITEKLAEQTPEPQVQVRRLAGDGATVTVSGRVGGQGVYPIERPTRTLSSMIAAAGGVAIQPEIAQITVIRGEASGTIWYEDLFDHPAADIALRSGDQIYVKEDSRTFTALGATGAQSRVPFESKAISAIEALATVGGLQTAAADPTGVFVFRNEPAEIANQLLARTDLIGTQRVVYVLDLTQPNGMFMARDFAIRDGDTVYVTEAPFVQFNKAIAAATGSLTAADTARSAFAQ